VLLVVGVGYFDLIVIALEVFEEKVTVELDELL